MKKGIIFDMDGVLIDSEKYYFDRRMEYFKRNRLKPDNTDFQSYVGQSNSVVWQLLVNDPQNRMKRKEDYEIMMSDDTADYKRLLIPGVEGFLKDLKNKKVGVALASAGDRDRNIRVLNECGLGTYFDIILGAEDVERNKPDPQIYTTAVNRLNLLPNECLVIEDSFNGILAAKRASIETWALKPKDYEMNQSQADIIFKSFESISERFFNDRQG